MVCTFTAVLSAMVPRPTSSHTVTPFTAPTYLTVDERSHDSETLEAAQGDIWLAWYSAILI